MTIREALETLVEGGELSTAQAEDVFEQLLRGELDPPQIASLLSLIQARGPTVDELVGGARAMRGHVTPVPVDPALPGALIDTCGTGGAPKTFNVSTLAAIVAAAAGPGRVLVAKHGNRSRTGRGSAEMLAALGVNVDATPEVQAACLREAGVCFCFAIHHHPAMKFAAPVRKSLGFPTIFNLLGPLTNPAGARRQLIGVSSLEAFSVLPDALAKLGVDRAVVAHSADGLDELSTTSTTHVSTIESGRDRIGSIDARDTNLPIASLQQLQAADLDDAVRIAREVLGGRRGAPLDIVALNAAAALFVGGVCESIPDGIPLAIRALETGAAAETLRRLVERSQRPA